MNATQTLVTTRQRAQEHAALLPPLLAEARLLASTVVLGTHGRRQAGAGEEFWQFRSALPGDAWHSIDWRRSGRTDAHYIRQREWQAAQSVIFWLDSGLSMNFSGDAARVSKGDRATLLALALMILLVNGGERIGLIEDSDPPRSGMTQIDRIFAQLDAREPDSDHDLPAERVFPKGARAVFLSDFLGEWAGIRDRITVSADRGVRGALLQVLDPIEESFPFDGRTEFQSMSGAVKFETLRARGIRQGYLERLAERKAALAEICRQTGWDYSCHHSSDAAMPALLWLYAALEKRR